MDPDPEHCNEQWYRIAVLSKAGTEGKYVIFSPLYKIVTEKNTKFTCTLYKPTAIHHILYKE